MFVRWFAVLLALSCVTTRVEAQAGRVALLIGQDAYPGGSSATIGLPKLANSGNDVARVAALLAKSGFDVLSCDGKRPGCFDLGRAALLKALDDLQAKALGADTALVYFAGHGMATDEGNILTPIDAKVDCATGVVTQGVAVEQFMAATETARHKLVILDACRNNPLGAVCPGLQGKKLSFTRIEAGALQGLLLVTSTQFGQEALDGPAGTNSPFAAALIAGLEAHPTIYFEQVMNEVGRATYEAAQKNNRFQQIPGKVVGTPAPADCLAGKGCVGDARMAALAQENEKLTADASAVRNILADEENKRGKVYTPEERLAAVTRIGRSLTSLAGSAEPKVKEANRLFGTGKVAEGRAKLDEALDDDELAAAELERLAKERRKTLARNARDAARLAQGSDVAKALVYYERATRNDPDDAQSWSDLATAAIDVGKLDVAKNAYEQAAVRARQTKDSYLNYWALLRLGEVTMSQGDLRGARSRFEAAMAVAIAATNANPGDVDWQRNLGATLSKLADNSLEQGDLATALKHYRQANEIMVARSEAEPDSLLRQSDLSVSLEKIGDVERAIGQLPEALDTYRFGLAIRVRLADADREDTAMQRALSVSFCKIGAVLLDQKQLSGALENFSRCRGIRERLVERDTSHGGWQYMLSEVVNDVADVLEGQGRLPAALENFSQALLIRQRLAALDESNANWQGGLAYNHARLGQLFVLMGRKPEALDMFRKGRAIVAPLVQSSGHQRWIGYLRNFDAEIAALHNR